mmetsp:Transcript_90872/g.281033  ORF Transcript_90872/g.281033 Transcript_90872/m.281033 type:complete len:546 (-) Transcript_90872:341-1978(-)
MRLVRARLRPSLAGLEALSLQANVLALPVLEPEEQEVVKTPVVVRILAPEPAVVLGLPRAVAAQVAGQRHNVPALPHGHHRAACLIQCPENGVCCRVVVLAPLWPVETGIHLQAQFLCQRRGQLDRVELLVPEVCEDGLWRGVPGPGAAAPDPGDVLSPSEPRCVQVIACRDLFAVPDHVDDPCRVDWWTRIPSDSDGLHATIAAGATAAAAAAAVADHMRRHLGIAGSSVGRSVERHPRGWPLAKPLVAHPVQVGSDVEEVAQGAQRGTPGDAHRLTPAQQPECHLPAVQLIDLQGRQVTVRRVDSVPHAQAVPKRQESGVVRGPDSKLHLGLGHLLHLACHPVGERADRRGAGVDAVHVLQRPVQGRVPQRGSDRRRRALALAEVDQQAVVVEARVRAQPWGEVEVPGGAPALEEGLVIWHALQLAANLVPPGLELGGRPRAALQLPRVSVHRPRADRDLLACALHALGQVEGCHNCALDARRPHAHLLRVVQAQGAQRLTFSNIGIAHHPPKAANAIHAVGQKLPNLAGSVCAAPYRHGPLD